MGKDIKFLKQEKIRKIQGKKTKTKNVFTDNIIKENKKVPNILKYSSVSESIKAEKEKNKVKLVKDEVKKVRIRTKKITNSKKE